MNFYFTKHALIEMSNDAIDLEVIKNISIEGEVIKTYPDDKKGASKLMLGWDEELKPVHVVCAVKDETTHIITAYRPDETMWNPDFKSKKVKK